MDQNWFDLQIQELSSVLTTQGLNIPIPEISFQEHSVTVDDNLARYIDHTLLKQDATVEDIIQLTNEAKQCGFASVCVHPSYLPLVARELENSQVSAGTVVGFPLGTNTTAAKAFECEECIANGADEIDMVLPIYALKNQDFKAVYYDMVSVVQVASGKVVKVILETGLLTKSEIVQACLLAKMAGVSFVKTSTGFGYGGATEEDVRLMRQVVGKECGVKASGGVRSKEDALKMLQAGANRIGTSAGVALVKGTKGDADEY